MNEIPAPQLQPSNGQSVLRFRVTVLGQWTRCAHHQTTHFHLTPEMAAMAAGQPWEWCNVCGAIVDAEHNRGLPQ